MDDVQQGEVCGKNGEYDRFKGESGGYGGWPLCWVRLALDNDRAGKNSNSEAD